MEGNILDGNLVKPEWVSVELWGQCTGTLPVTDPFLQTFISGIDGHNIGSGNGVVRIYDYIYGTHAGRYYLIGADSGVGKTTIADYMYVISLYEDCKRTGKNLYIYYCSFEIGRMDKISRWISCYVFKLFGELMPSNYIMSYIKGLEIRKEDRLKIVLAYAKVMEMCKCIRMMDDIMHPTAIYNEIVDLYEKHDGIVIREELSDEDKKKYKKGKVIKYIAKDPHELRVLIIDHLALVGHESGLDLKGLMDKQSFYNMLLRNKFKMCIIAIQQFSTDLMSWQRTMKKDAKVLIPQRLDFGDSKTTFRDADVVIGYVKPLIYDYAEFEKYRILGDYGPDCLGGYFIAQCLIKNRYGMSNRVCPVFLDPVSSHMYDLPLQPQNVMVMQEWYDKAYQTDIICKTFSPKSV